MCDCPLGLSMPESQRFTGRYRICCYPSFTVDAGRRSRRSPVATCPSGKHHRRARLGAGRSPWRLRPALAALQVASQTVAAEPASHAQVAAVISSPDLGVSAVAAAGVLCAFPCVVDALPEQCLRRRPSTNPLVAAVFRTKWLLRERYSATCQRRRRPGQVRRRQGRLQITAVMEGARLSGLASNGAQIGCSVAPMSRCVGPRDRRLGTWPGFRSRSDR